MYITFIIFINKTNFQSNFCVFMQRRRKNRTNNGAHTHGVPAINWKNSTSQRWKWDRERMKARGTKSINESLERERCDLAGGKFNTQMHTHIHVHICLLTLTHLHDCKIYGMHFVIKSAVNVRKCKMFATYSNAGWIRWQLRIVVGDDVDSSGNDNIQKARD